MTLCNIRIGFRIQQNCQAPSTVRFCLSPMFYRRSTLVVLLTLIFLSFFGTLSPSAWMFPANYDWRYRLVSSLFSPRDNPRHYWLAASGLAFTAVLMLPFAYHLRPHPQPLAPRMAKTTAAGLIRNALRHSVF